MPRTVCLALLSLMLSACASQPGTRSVPASISTPGGTPVEQDGAQQAGGSQSSEPGTHARSTLLAQARTARDGGEYASARALLERALRMDPTDGALYLELARTLLQSGDVERARAMAERGLLYCDERTCRALERLLRRLPVRRAAVHHATGAG
jgi:Flp pilus assembly protein TadD